MKKTQEMVRYFQPISSGNIERIGSNYAIICGLAKALEANCR